MGQIEKTRKEDTMSKKYYLLEQGNKKADLYIFGSISSYPWREKDKDAYGIVKELQELEADEIRVHINSTGGSVAEGLAIYNVLKNSSAKIVTYCDGFACSAASVVFMAGDERVMNEASLLMIHNAWTYAQGNAAEFRKQADDLDIVTSASVKAYMRHATISEEEVKKMMDEETWITAEKAKEYGFATQVYEEDDDDVNQSALMNIRERIMTAAVPGQLEAVAFDAKEIAKEILAELETRKPKETEQINGSAWSTFFSGRKGE